MMKKILIFMLLFCAVFSVSAQSSAYQETLNNPQGIKDLFLTCPYVGFKYFVENKNSDFGQLFYDENANLGDPLEVVFAEKQRLLAGEYENEVKAKLKVVDEANGYLHIAQNNTDLTMVYYKYPDGSYLPVFRLKTWSDDHSFTITWQSYHVQNGQWELLENDNLIVQSELLPKNTLEKILLRSPTSEDSQNILVSSYAHRTFWDIYLPQYGTTAYLIPLNFWALPEGNPDVSFGGGGFADVPIPTKSAYAQWFEKNFQLGSHRKALELRWDKPHVRFAAGKVIPWNIYSDQPAK